MPSAGHHLAEQFASKNRRARRRRIVRRACDRSIASEAESSPFADLLPRFVNPIRIARAAIPDGPNPPARSPLLCNARDSRPEDGRNTKDFLLPGLRRLFPEAFE